MNKPPGHRRSPVWPPSGPPPAFGHERSPSPETRWSSHGENPFERFPDGRPKVPDALIQRARGCSKEVFAILPGQRTPNHMKTIQILHPGKNGRPRLHAAFMPLRPDLDAVLNAKAKAAGLGRMYNQTAIDMLQPGDVLVVDLFGQG